MERQKGFAPILILVILVVLALGGYFLYQRYSKTATQPQSVTESVTTPTKTSPTSAPKKANLNPNTGSLYGDIKVRLNEVLK